jgi:hypothetical protein
MTTLLALLLALGVAVPQAAKNDAVLVTFREFLAPSSTELKPSDKLRRLQGQRVRIVGFMAEMEHMPEGYFYLCARPIFCDESGGGIGELPVDAVRVVVRASRGKPIKFVPQPIEIHGVLELGGQSEMEPDSWAVRLLTDNFSVHPIKPAAPKLRQKSKR